MDVWWLNGKTKYKKKSFNLISWWTSELLRLFGCHSRRHVRLFDLDVTSQLIGLKRAHVTLSEGDCVLDPVAKLDVVQVVQQVAQLQLDTLVHHHAQDALAMLIFTVWSEIKTTYLSVTSFREGIRLRVQLGLSLYLHLCTRFVHFILLFALSDEKYKKKNSVYNSGYNKKDNSFIQLEW